jgi:hypothetical protein
VFTLVGMESRKATSPTRAKQGDGPTRSVPAKPDHGENSASTITEAPLPARRDPLVAHDFPDGGGSGGAEAFSRQRVKARKRKP